MRACSTERTPTVTETDVPRAPARRRAADARAPAALAGAAPAGRLRRATARVREAVALMHAEGVGIGRGGRRAGAAGRHLHRRTTWSGVALDARLERSRRRGDDARPVCAARPRARLRGRARDDRACASAMCW